MKYVVTLFNKASSSSPSSAIVGRIHEYNSLKELHGEIRLYAWSPFVFKNSRRKNANFIKTNFIVGDFDGGLSIPEALERLKKHGLSYSLTLTKSHQREKKSGSSIKPKCDRFRIVLPLSSEIVDGGTYLNTFINFLQIFPESDQNCSDLARFYFPSIGKGQTYLTETGKAFTVAPTKATYDDVKNGFVVTKGKKAPEKVTVREFLSKAHTGLPGDFNNGLYKTAYCLSKNGKSIDEINAMITKIAPEKLDQNDLRTIQSAFDGAREFDPENVNKKNADQSYLEDTRDFLSLTWNNRFQVVMDEAGSRFILEEQPNRTLRSVEIHYLLSEATKIFNGTPFLRKSARIRDAVENYLNLLMPLDSMPFSALLFEDERCAFNRLGFSAKPVKTPIFDELIGRCSNGNALCAFIYSLFFPDSDRQQYVWIYGQGGDGKGTLARFLKKCLGSSFHSDRAGGASHNKHFTASFVGKRLAVFSDSNATMFVTSEMFKELSGGDSIKVERKYQHPFTTSLDTKFIFMSNSLPVISSQRSDQRRIILCEIEHIKGDFDSRYEEKLWAEREGILWKCQKAYLTLTHNNGPIKCVVKNAVDVAEDSEVQFNVVFESKFELDDFSDLTSALFFKEAKPLCEQYRIRFEDFRSWVIRKFALSYERDKASDNKRVIRGIKLKEALGSIMVKSIQPSSLKRIELVKKEESNERKSFSFSEVDGFDYGNPLFRGDVEDKSIVECSLKTEEWMTTEEAARFLRISKASLLNLSSNGKVPYYKLERRNRYLKSDLLKLLLSTRRGGFDGN